jgi:hypothetical protein
MEYKEKGQPTTRLSSRAEQIVPASRDDVESRDLLLACSTDIAWREQKAGPSTRELISEADQFTWSG